MSNAIPRFTNEDIEAALEAIGDAVGVLVDPQRLAIRNALRRLHKPIVHEIEETGMTLARDYAGAHTREAIGGTSAKAERDRMCAFLRTLADERP